MQTSKFLSKALGLYFLIISCAMMVNMPQFIHYVDIFSSNQAVMFLAGFISLIVGILMVVSHSIWQWSWRLIITILAWVILIKGASLIFFPELLQGMTFSYTENSVYAYSGAALDFLLGLILVYFGFRKKK